MAISDPDVVDIMAAARCAQPRSYTPPSNLELADAVREFLHALDDPRHIASWQDRGEGENVMDKRRKLDALLSRL